MVCEDSSKFSSEGQPYKYTDHLFKVGPLAISYIDKYRYLGVFFLEFLSFEENAEILSKSNGRALGAIVSKLKRNNFMRLSTYTKLYDMCVAPSWTTHQKYGVVKITRTRML